MKKLFVLFLFSIVFCLLSNPVFAQTEINTQDDFTTNVLDSVNDSIIGEKIQKFSSDITIKKDGSIEVKETIVYDFTSLSRHGIFRNIPYTILDKSKRYDMTYTFKSVTDEKGKKYKYTKSRQDEQWVLKIGDPNKTITGVHTYIISYSVKGALRYFKDHDELYWNITGNGWNIPIKETTATILLPEEIAQQKIQMKCFTGSYGSTKQNCTGTTTGQKTEYKTTLFLNSYEGLTTVLGFPKGTTAVLLPTEYVPFFETPLGKIVLVLIGITAVCWYIILPLYIVIKWFTKGRDPDVGRAVTAGYDAPKGSNKKPLTPAQTGALLDETVNKKDIFSIIVDLARRGYLRIEERDKKDFYLIKLPVTAKASNQLLPFEQKLFDALFPSGDESRLKDTKLYTVILDIQTLLYKDMVAQGYFIKNPQTTRTIYTLLGVAGVFTFNFVLAFASFTFGRHMPKKTLLGASQANVARGLKNFLTSQERQLNFQGDKQILFEKFLPFAVAFGVEKAWAKRFESFDLKSPEWYSSYNNTGFNSYLFASSLGNSYSNFSASSTPPSSSGSGFSGGGSSGGGGGGGGGGSW